MSQNSRKVKYSKGGLLKRTSKSGIINRLKINMKDNYFVLHIGPDSIPNRPSEKQIKTEKIEKKEIKETVKRSNDGIKEVLKDGAKQFFVTLLILVVGFFAINYQAYFSILKNYVNGLLNKNEQTIEIQNTDTASETQQKILSTNKDTINQVKEIPNLTMEIFPTDMRLIIPRIDQNIPVVRVPSENLIKRDWKALEQDMQESLKDGVVHYPGTSMPDQIGNTVITGHSSYFPWDPGRFKDVFALLHQVNVGDKIISYYNQHKYIYEVSEKKVVLPTEIDILKQTPDKRLTLITCTPVGTNLKRLVVIATLIEEEV